VLFVGTQFSNLFTPVDTGNRHLFSASRDILNQPRESVPGDEDHKRLLLIACQVRYVVREGNANLWQGAWSTIGPHQA
jgi:hypothetical protein